MKTEDQISSERGLIKYIKCWAIWKHYNHLKNYITAILDFYKVDYEINNTLPGKRQQNKCYFS